MLNYEKKAVFFDLDHTLWDFERNAHETLSELYFTYKLDELFGASAVERFISTYNKHNQRLWGLYNLGQIDKASLRKRRFGDTFEELGADKEALPLAFEEDYLLYCPRKTHLFPHALEVLEYLKGRYSLHLISNGFQEACTTKLTYSGLEKYFDTIVISEVVGVLKPDPAIFMHTLSKAGVEAKEAVMIGDNFEADVKGALNVGIEAVYFNPTGINQPSGPHLHIGSLSDLKLFL
jgi:YjjG family noncanonical pyrimidine nucleotidase